MQIVEHDHGEAEESRAQERQEGGGGLEAQEDDQPLAEGGPLRARQAGERGEAPAPREMTGQAGIDARAVGAQVPAKRGRVPARHWTV